MITIPTLDAQSVLSDTDQVMITHANGTTERISGADLKSQILAEVKDGTTIESFADVETVITNLSQNKISKSQTAGLLKCHHLWENVFSPSTPFVSFITHTMVYVVGLFFRFSHVSSLRGWKLPGVRAPCL